MVGCRKLIFFENALIFSAGCDFSTREFSNGNNICTVLVHINKELSVAIFYGDEQL